MKLLLTVATVAMGLGLAVPAVAQTSKDAGKESPLAQSPCKESHLAQLADAPLALLSPKDAGKESPLAQLSPKDAGKESPLAQLSPKDAGKESPLAQLSPKDAGKESPLAAADCK
jgi:hypothetical protein